MKIYAGFKHSDWLKILTQPIRALKTSVVWNYSENYPNTIWPWSLVSKLFNSNRYKRVKEEEEKLRADMRKDSKVKRMREKVTGRGLTTGYLEGGDSDEEDISIAAIKNKYKKNKKGGYICFLFLIPFELSFDFRL